MPCREGEEPGLRSSPGSCRQVSSLLWGTLLMTAFNELRSSVMIDNNCALTAPMGTWLNTN